MPGDKAFRPAVGGRSLTIAILGVALLCASPAFSAARTSAQHHVASNESKQLQRETVDQRIQTLHTDLAITPAEEADWQVVASVMRRNESNIRKMVEDRKQAPIQDISAVDDLVIYQKFNQAHVDGLKDLIASFQTLYQSMPDSQKVVADRVFRGFGRERPLHS